MQYDSSTLIQGNIQKATSAFKKQHYSNFYSGMEQHQAPVKAEEIQHNFNRDSSQFQPTSKLKIISENSINISAGKLGRQLR